METLLTETKIMIIQDQIFGVFEESGTKCNEVEEAPERFEVFPPYDNIVSLGMERERQISKTCQQSLTAGFMWGQRGKKSKLPRGFET